jgi:hypothetical protein
VVSGFVRFRVEAVSKGDFYANHSVILIPAPFGRGRETAGNAE